MDKSTIFWMVETCSTVNIKGESLVREGIHLLSIYNLIYALAVVYAIFH